MRTYYNDIDPYCCEWLRNLIAEGLIAPGDVDERSILDVRASDLKGYGQIHLFAGLGGWPRAMRLAGWADERACFTFSCPCQPFSAAGKREGAGDQRHLWPAVYALVAELAPAICFGEQVASKLGRAWLSAVRADLEALGYAVGAADLCAAGVGAPHIRQRLWFVAQSECAERSGRAGHRPEGLGTQNGAREPHSLGLPSVPRGELADPMHAGRPEGRAGARNGSSTGSGALGELGHAGKQGSGRNAGAILGAQGEGESEGRGVGREPDEPIVASTNPWRDCIWLPCTDGKQRPTQPGIFPLAHGIPARVAKLRAAGNAIVPQVAAQFIKAAM